MARDYATELTTLQSELATYKSARTQIITTGQSWQLRNGDDNRSLTNVSLDQLNQLIAETESKIAILQQIVDGTAAPKAVRIRVDVL